MFDIDLTDYDDVRTCGKEAHICSACWPLMAVAVQVCNTAPAFRVCLMQTRRLVLTAYCPHCLFPKPPCLHWLSVRQSCSFSGSPEKRSRDLWLGCMLGKSPSQAV